MFNSEIINRLITFIEKYDGIADKNKLANAVKQEFSLTQDRKVYYNEYFAVRFSKSESKYMSNTVLSLSSLQKYDNRPFIVCIVSPDKNYLMLANTTFLKRISHSSKELRVDNIRGSFNGSDIMTEYNSIENCPKNFEYLYAYHAGLSFQDNLERLVESTNGIVGRNPKFSVKETIKKRIMESINRAQVFVLSPEYTDLKKDLDNRVLKVQKEIAKAAFIDNVNVRGRIIEYLITDSESNIKTQIIDALRNKKPLPEFKTADKLGDFSKDYGNYFVEIDIKTKVLFLDGNPKAYNIDKLLEFLALERAVYMIYILGVDEKGLIVTRLCSCFDERLIDATNIQHHWAGRNTRGVTQFAGHALRKILEYPDKTIIDSDKAHLFIETLISK